MRKRSSLTPKERLGFICYAGWIVAVIMALVWLFGQIGGG